MNYKINPDGSVVYNDYTATQEEVEKLIFELMFSYGRPLECSINNKGVAVYYTLDRIKIGCQTIQAYELRKFVDEYKAGDWKKPEEEVLVKIGDRVQHTDGDVYLVARIDHKHVLLIDIKTGNRWDDFCIAESSVTAQCRLRDLTGDDAFDKFTVVDRDD